MSANELEDLAGRVALLERDMAVVRGILWRSEPVPAAPPPPVSYPPVRAPGPWGAPQPAPWARPAPVPPPAPWPGPAPAPRPAFTGSQEASFGGTWFARAGAVAVLVGAGFAFKYGIDRGIITPTLRVLIGLAVGLAFIAWGTWAHRRTWVRLAQAVSAGGIGICYLSILVAHGGYHLISGPVALAALAAVTLGDVALTWAYNSLALAVLATVLATLDPPLAFRASPPPGVLYPFLALVGAGGLALARLRRWRALEPVVMGSVWILLGYALVAPAFWLPLSVAAGAAVAFTAVPFLRTRAAGVVAGPEDVLLLVLNAAVAYGFAMFLVQRSHPGWAVGVTLSLAAAYAGMAAVTWAAARRDVVTWQALAGVAVVLVTVAVPLQYRGLALADGWAVLGLVLVVLGRRAPSIHARVTGVVVATLGALAGVGIVLAHQYQPVRVLLSVPSTQMAVLVVVAAGVALSLGRERDPAIRAWYPAVAVAANALALVWFSAEALAHFPAASGAEGANQSLLFSLTALYGLYAAGLLAVGVGARLRWARMAGIGLFGITIAKMVLTDIWTLTTGQRVLAFIGLGAVLLACSVLYHRFKDLILAPDRDRTAAAPGVGG